MPVGHTAIRPARPDDEPAIAALVIEGFADKFRPAFGPRLDRGLKVMEKWVELEHACGGVRSLVVENRSGPEIAASIGLRTENPNKEALSRDAEVVIERYASQELVFEGDQLKEIVAEALGYFFDGDFVGFRY